MYAQDSIELLQKSGINFKRHDEEGISVSEFAELLMTSGIVLGEHVKWLSFHRFVFYLSLFYTGLFPMTGFPCRVFRDGPPV